MFLARQAVARGITVGVLMRGYRGESEKKGAILLPHAHPVDPYVYGDEAALMAWQIPEVPIGIGADRVKSYHELINQWGKTPDWVLLDDGFQSTSVQKDLEILLVTGSSRSDRLFRDFDRCKLRAHLLLQTKGPWPQQDWSGSEVLAMKRIYDEQVPRSKSVVLVTGVGAPQEVRDSWVKDLDLSIHRHFSFSDHHRYSQEEIQAVFDATPEGMPIALTGKDYVKWRWQLARLPNHPRLKDLYGIEPRLNFALTPSEEIWNRVLWGD